MKFGVFYSYWTKEWRGDLKYYARKAKSLGLDILEVGGDNLLGMSDCELDELKSLTKDLGIEISTNIGPAKQYDVASSDSATRAKGIAFLTDIMKKMDRLDSRVIVGVMYTYWPNDFSDLDKPAIWKRGVDSVSIMGKTAQDLGIDMCMEVVNRYETHILNTAEEAVRFCEDVGNPNIKILLDTFHMNIEEDNIANAIRTAGKHLRALHAGECNRKIPGQGPLPWAEIGQALRDINFEGNVVMESFVQHGGQIAEDIKVWRDLTGGADEAAMDDIVRSGLAVLKSNFLK